MSELKTAEEFARERLNNSPAFDYKFMAGLLEDFHLQFKPSDAVIFKMFPTSYNERAAATELRDKIFK